MSIFGQNPADITGALFKAKNFSDIPDKAAARTNLDVPSKAEVQYNSVPVGMILPFWGSVAPAGYLPCSGQTITSGSFPELVTFLGGGASATVPDLRGEFLRGWDNGRGVDVGRTALSSQVDDLKSHRHYKLNVDIVGSTYTANSGWTGTGNTGGLYFTPATGFDAGYAGVSTGLAGGTETRPRNVSVLYCIKAYSSVSNFTSSVNIAGLVSDYSTLAAAAVKYADFLGTNQNISGNGYQKLPGGLILQWGTGTSDVAGIKAISLPISYTSLNYVATCVSRDLAQNVTFGVQSAAVGAFNMTARTAAGLTGTTFSFTAIGY